MRIISFIEDQEVIKIILKQLGLWIVENLHPKPMARCQRPIICAPSDRGDSKR